ncbi:MAG: hypothetical protein V7752_20860 [Halopseudomonas sp.]
MEIFQFKRSSVSINGDYYQIMFDDDSDDVDAPYFLVQCDFEFFSKKSYVECNNEKLTGHYLVNSVDIDDRAFTIRYGHVDQIVVKVIYQATNEEQDAIITAAKTMFDRVNIIK